MTPLHLPLSLLPGPVPMWTPGILQYPDCPPHSVSIDYPSQDGAMWIMESACAGHRPILLESASSYVYIDLTPPPRDSDGWPTRVDALPIVVGMVARAMGHPVGTSSLRRGRGIAWSWRLDTVTADGVETTGFPDFDMFADVAIDDPLADRLAAVAILNAKPWERQ